MRKFLRGSVLVYTLFFLIMFLVMGLALSAVVLIQQRGAITLGDSIKAFQSANDGFEDLIAKKSFGTTIDSLGWCSDGTVQNSDPVQYSATFRKRDDAENLVDADCGDDLSSIERVKVVATVGSSTRSIETAFLTVAQKEAESTFYVDPEHVALEEGGNLFYVAPEKRGNASGVGAKNAAGYLQEDFWKKIGNSVRTKGTKVIFLNGEYHKGMLVLKEIGDNANKLILEGEKKEKVVMNFNDGASGMNIEESRNIVVRNFTFTGAYLSDPKLVCVFRFFDSKKMTLENADFKKMKVLNCSVAVAGSNTDDITLKNLTFDTIGPDQYTHAIYVNFGAKNVRILKSTFKDIAGTFVRYRDGSEPGIIEDCTFISPKKSAWTKQGGTFFINLPGYNTIIDGNRRRMEIIPTKIQIKGNRFIDENLDKGFVAGVVSFHHAGEQPPGGRDCLFNEEEKKILEEAKSSTKVQRKKLINGCVINMDNLKFINNSYVELSNAGTESNDLLIFRSSPSKYSQFFPVFANISDLVNQTSIFEDSMTLDK